MEYPKKRRGTKKLTPEDYERVRKLAALGLTQKEIGYLLDRSARWVRATLSGDERFAAAYTKGRAEGVAFATGQLREKIKQGNLAAIIFYLKTQARWSERVKVEVSEVASDKPKTIEELYQRWTSQHSRS